MTHQVRSAIVFGGTGYVGGHVVRRLLADGATVLVPSRRADQLDRLRRSCGAADALETVVADLSSPTGADEVAARLSGHDGIDLGVAAVGGWWEGVDLVDLPYETWATIVSSHLTAHFLAARTAAPHLRAGGAYLTLNGIAALQPEPGSGPVSVTGAAQTMLLDVFRAEADRSVPRVSTRWHEICVVNPIVDDGAAATATEAVVEMSVVMEAIVGAARDGTPDQHRITLGRL